MFMKKIIIIGAYPSTEYTEKLLFDCIGSLENKGYDLMIVSHYPVPQYIQEKVNYYIFDKDNTLDPISLSPSAWMFNDIFDIQIKNNARVGVIVKNMLNGISFAKHLGYDYFLYMESDNIIHPDDFVKLDESINDMYVQDKKMAFFNHIADSNIIYESLIFGGTPDEFLNKISSELINQFLTDLRGETTLERLFYSIFVNQKDEYLIINEPSSYFLNKSVINKITGTYICEVIKSLNDDRYFMWVWNIGVNKNELKITINGVRTLNVMPSHWFYDLINENELYSLDIDDGEFVINKEFIIDETTKDYIKSKGFIKLK